MMAMAMAAACIRNKNIINDAQWSSSTGHPHVGNHERKAAITHQLPPARLRTVRFHYRCAPSTLTCLSPDGLRPSSLSCPASRLNFSPPVNSAQRRRQQQNRGSSRVPARGAAAGRLPSRPKSQARPSTPTKCRCAPRCRQARRAGMGRRSRRVATPSILIWRAAR